jgi:hypothetical protein
VRNHRPKCVGPMAFVAHAARALLMVSFTDAGLGVLSQQVVQ